MPGMIRNVECEVRKTRVSYHQSVLCPLDELQQERRKRGGGICHPLRVFPFRPTSPPASHPRSCRWFPAFRSHPRPHRVSLCASARGALERVQCLLRFHGRARVGDRHEPDVLGALGEPALQPFEVDRAVQSAPRVLRTVSPIAARVAAFHFLACSRSLAAATSAAP